MKVLVGMGVVVAVGRGVEVMLGNGVFDGTGELVWVGGGRVEVFIAVVAVKTAVCTAGEAVFTRF